MFDLEAAQLLFAQAEKMNLQPVWLTDYGLFSITYQSSIIYVCYSNSLMNSHLSSHLARNKHLTRTVLAGWGMPNIPYALPKDDREAAEFLKIHKVIIIKPTLGTHSRDVYLIKSAEKLKGFDIRNYIFEKYIKGKEMRYLVVDGDVIAVHRKLYDGPINDADKVKRLSLPVNEWDENTVKLAEKIAKVMYLKFAAVDFLVDEKNETFVLEVNSSPGLRFFEKPTEGPAINITKIFLELTLREAMRFELPL